MRHRIVIDTTDEHGVTLIVSGTLPISTRKKYLVYRYNAYRLVAVPHRGIRVHGDFYGYSYSKHRVPAQAGRLVTSPESATRTAWSCYQPFTAASHGSSLSADVEYRHRTKYYGIACRPTIVGRQCRHPWHTAGHCALALWNGLKGSGSLIIGGGSLILVVVVVFIQSCGHKTK